MGNSSYDEAVKALETAKAARKKAKEELEAFRKENKIKKDSDPAEIKEKATRVKYKELMKAVTEARATADKAEAKAKELKPVKNRETKYNYPADCDTADKKKQFRTKERARIKREAKEAAGGGKKKEKEGSKKEEKKSEAGKSDSKKVSLKNKDKKSED